MGDPARFAGVWQSAAKAERMKSGEFQSISSYTQVYRNLYRDNYIVMQYNFVQFLTEHLTDVSRIFEADLQSVLVLAIVGQMELQARIRSRLHGDGEMPLDLAGGRAARINASSIAEVSGIPRETVRRKLEGLARRGWVARDPNGLWHLTRDGPNMPPARRELIDLDRRSMERVSRLLGQMHALAVEALSKGTHEAPQSPD